MNEEIEVLALSLFKARMTAYWNYQDEVAKVGYSRTLGPGVAVEWYKECVVLATEVMEESYGRKV